MCGQGAPCHSICFFGLLWPPFFAFAGMRPPAVLAAMPRHRDPDWWYSVPTTHAADIMHQYGSARHKNIAVPLNEVAPCYVDLVCSGLATHRGQAHIMRWYDFAVHKNQTFVESRFTASDSGCGP